MPDYENFCDCVMDFNDWFVYDVSSPTGLRWKVDRYGGRNYTILRIKAGEVAGRVDPVEGYGVVRLEQSRYKVHRVIWEMFKGAIPSGMIIDHINRIETITGLITYDS